MPAIEIALARTPRLPASRPVRSKYATAGSPVAGDQTSDDRYVDRVHLHGPIIDMPTTIKAMPSTCTALIGIWYATRPMTAAQMNVVA